jgi:predicted hydrocarbon binding protein
MATNAALRAVYDCLNEIMGKNGAKLIFDASDLTHIFENPPDYDLNPCVPTEEQAKIYLEIPNLVGLNGALAIWRRMGVTITRYADEYGHIFDAFKELPDKEQYQKSVEMFVMASGKGRLAVRDDGMTDYDCFDCWFCENRELHRPMCTLYAGGMQYLADLAFGKGAYRAVEKKCKVLGDETCLFVLEKDEE